MDIKHENYEPTEEDRVFIRDFATNLSEKEKTRFVTDVREIYAGGSTLLWEPTACMGGLVSCSRAGM